MAMAHIEMTEGRVAPVDAKKLMAAVRRAMIEVLRIPPDDPLVRLSTFPRDHVLAPARMREVTVHVLMFAGRPETTKNRLYAEVANRFEALGVPRGDVLVVVHDVPVANWGVGGVPAGDLDLDIVLAPDAE
ncbi:tautomerase family protein [Cellulomonas sp. Sa3CUA2]|uniref:Tautomerase family protein n=2 Tax=Cellulomonas avistercoris TaxID=2762242 RepID=A0ABR8Q9F8_9CELL|nr:tautomerase family protein [Cellulomonas avistercoris]